MISPSVNIAFVSVFLHDCRQKRYHLNSFALRK
jgi:hypothetical protein